MGQERRFALQKCQYKNPAQNGPRGLTSRGVGSLLSVAARKLLIKKCAY
jgi:hypothetical protein